MENYTDVYGFLPPKKQEGYDLTQFLDKPVEQEDLQHAEEMARVKASEAAKKKSPTAAADKKYMSQSAKFINDMYQFSELYKEENPFLQIEGEDVMGKKKQDLTVLAPKIGLDKAISDSFEAANSGEARMYGLLDIIKENPNVSLSAEDINRSFDGNNIYGGLMADMSISMINEQPLISNKDKVNHIAKLLGPESAFELFMEDKDLFKDSNHVTFQKDTCRHIAHDIGAGSCVRNYCRTMACI
jgi:hypothetical protein